MYVIINSSIRECTEVVVYRSGPRPPHVPKWSYPIKSVVHMQLKIFRAPSTFKLLPAPLAFDYVMYSISFLFTLFVCIVFSLNKLIRPIYSRGY